MDRDLIDEVFVGQNFKLLPLLFVIYLAIAAGKLLAGYATTRLDAAVTEQIAQSVRVDLYRKS